jgi:DNA-binding transcriptional ArsR family regulator
MGVLRIHFTGTDLARTQVAAVPDPFWEIMLSLHWLQGSYWRAMPAGRLVFGAWHAAVVDRLRRNGTGGEIRDWLMPLSPPQSDFPDFLTPAEGLLGLDAGLDAVLATTRHQLRRELGPLRGSPNARDWPRTLAAGGVTDLRRLERVLRAYHGHAIAPYWSEVRRHVEAEHTRRQRDVAAGGVERMLAGLAPTMRWRPPVLEVRHPTTRDLHLNGRGLTLIPSYFCWTAIPLADPALPPVLVYAVEHRASPAPAALPAAARTGLGTLLGSTRAAILELVEGGCTVSELATRTGVSVASASRHAQILREAGLVTSHRHSNTVTHLLTPLGSALLRGEL